MSRRELRQPLEYRNATLDEINSLAEMNQQLILDEGHGILVSIDQLQKRMTNWLSGEYQGVLFSIDGDDIGYALYRREEHWTYLRQFFVKSSHRRSGIGREAVQYLKQNYWHDAPRVRLDVLVRNSVGIAFWKALGCQEYCVTMELSTGSDNEM